MIHNWKMLLNTSSNLFLGPFMLQFFLTLEHNQIEHHNPALYLIHNCKHMCQPVLLIQQS